MLNMGFREDIEEVLKYLPEDRQTVLFSQRCRKRLWRSQNSIRKMR